MSALRRFAKRLAATLFGWRDDDRMRDELAEHLALLTEEGLCAGLPPDEARRRARHQIGGADAIVEAALATDRRAQRIRGRSRRPPPRILFQSKFN
jgi:cytochrome P450